MGSRMRGALVRSPLSVLALGAEWEEGRWVGGGGGEKTFSSVLIDRLSSYHGLYL